MTEKKPNNKNPRGRPPGPSSKGRKTETHLFETAIALFRERGYEATTLRSIAAQAGVSVGLLYRYFPNKRAVVLALYTRLTDAFVVGVALESGPWRTRVLSALRESLAVLGPYRPCLRALVPTLVSAEGQGVPSTETGFSRDRVAEVFVRAVVGAEDAPLGELGAALGRLCYTAHLSLILWWLLDQSSAQRATEALLSRIEALLPMATLALGLPGVSSQVLSVDTLVGEALFGLPPSQTDL